MHWDEPTLIDLEVVATLSSQVSEASIEMLQRQDKLDAELRRLIRQGISIDALSDATGLSPDSIRLRTRDIDYI